jgi:hypothetical protein
MTLLYSAHVGVLALLAATPLLLFFDNTVAGNLLEFFAALGVTIAALGLRPGVARHFFAVIRLPAAVAIALIILMLLQMLPLPVAGLSKSVWQSAASALDARLWAVSTVDPTLTLMALCRFASIIGIFLVACAASIERYRAEIVLWFLATASALVGLCYPLTHLGSVFAPVSQPSEAAMLAGGVLGVVLFAAVSIMLVERYEMRGRDEVIAKLVVPLGFAVAALAVCFFILIAAGASRAVCSACCGGATIAITYFLRRLGFGPKTGLAIACLAILLVGGAVLTQSGTDGGDIAVRYASNSPPNAVAQDSRIFHEVGLAGSGAGTADVLGALYGAQEAVDYSRHSTFAALISIEIGRPALWLVLAFAFLIIGATGRATFLRGRDFFYPLAGAGVSVAMLLNSFSGTALSSLAISTIMAVTLGLSFAQSISRSV